MRAILLALLLGATGCAFVPTNYSGTVGEESDGGALYLEHCEACHGYDGRGTSRGADLYWRLGEMDVDDVIDAVLVGEGLMEPVALTEEDAEAVAYFVLDNLATP